VDDFDVEEQIKIYLQMDETILEQYADAETKKYEEDQQAARSNRREEAQMIKQVKQKEREQAKE